MATDEGLQKTPMQYFCGFSKFFQFQRKEDKLVSYHKCKGESILQNTVSCLHPIQINNTLNGKISKIACVTWSTMFISVRTEANTKEVEISGWWDGRIVNAKSMSLPNISMLKATWQRALIITDNGLCHSLFNDNHHDIKIINDEPEIKFKTCDIGDLHAVLLDENGKVYSVKEEKKPSKTNENTSATEEKLKLFPVHLQVKIDTVSCGKEHVLLLSDDLHRVYSFGLGSRGQLGHGCVDLQTMPLLVEALTGITIIQVSAGGWHSVALSDIGDVYTWGWNNHGQLGITCQPPEVPSAFYTLPYPVDFCIECNVDYVACGSMHTVALTTKPRCIWTWGWGEYGQLGHGEKCDKVTPTKLEYFDQIDGEIVNVMCGPWQTIVTVEIKEEAKTS